MRLVPSAVRAAISNAMPARMSGDDILRAFNCICLSCPITTALWGSQRMICAPISMSLSTKKRRLSNVMVNISLKLFSLQPSPLGDRVRLQLNKRRRLPAGASRPLKMTHKIRGITIFGRGRRLDDPVSLPSRPHPKNTSLCCGIYGALGREGDRR